MINMANQSLIDTIIRYYEDPQATRPVPRDSNGQIILNFGKAIQGRATEPAKLFVKNEHPNGYPISLQAESSDGDLVFLRTPSKLRAGEVGEIQLQFNCPMERIDPLNAKWGYKLMVLVD